METRTKKLKVGMKVFISPKDFDPDLEDATGKITKIDKRLTYCQVLLDKPVLGLRIDPYFSEEELTRVIRLKPITKGEVEK